MKERNPFEAKDKNSKMKRKSIILVLLSFLLAISTIAVRAEKYSNRIESSPSSTSPLAVHPGLVSSLVAALSDARQEEADLVLAGSVFLLLSFLSLRRARRTAGHS